MSSKGILKEALKISLLREAHLVVTIIATGAVTTLLVLSKAEGIDTLPTAMIFLWAWTEVVRSATAQYEFLKYERYK